MSELAGHSQKKLRPSITLKLNWKITALCLATFPVLVSLGFWQLERADEKRQILRNVEEKKKIPPQNIESIINLPGAAISNTAVELTGEADHHRVFLLDNRIHRGQVGFDVLVPVKVESLNASDVGQDYWVMVNRGWIKAGRTRSEKPAVVINTTLQAYTGTVYVPPGEKITLGEVNTDKIWPRIVQTFDSQYFKEIFGAEVFPYQIRLNIDHPEALERSWQSVNIKPEKHTAYAVQWFAMAVALAIWIFWANIRLRQGKE